MTRIETRLAELGLTLPTPVPPIATYVPTVISGSLLHISGQVSVDADGGITGVVGEEIDLETAQQAARLCALNLVAQMKAATDGDLDRVKRIVKLGGFVQAGPGFFDIPSVINGASDLLVDLFGDRGRHARSAVGVYRLPRNFAVEIDAVVELA